MSEPFSIILDLDQDKLKKHTGTQSSHSFLCLSTCVSSSLFSRTHCCFSSKKCENYTHTHTYSLHIYKHICLYDLLLMSIIMYMVCMPAQSHPTLCDPMDCSLLGSSVHGILQATILEWVAISFSWGCSWPRNWTGVSCNSLTGRWVLLSLSLRGSPYQ